MLNQLSHPPHFLVVFWLPIQFCYFLKRFYSSIISTLNRGLELLTPRSRAVCSTDWASQVLFSFVTCSQSIQVFISSWFSFGRLYVSWNFFFSARLSRMLAYHFSWCFLIILCISVVSVLHLSHFWYYLCLFSFFPWWASLRICKFGYLFKEPALGFIYFPFLLSFLSSLILWFPFFLLTLGFVLLFLFL